MIVLALDPGETTGCAVVNGNFITVCSGDFPETHIEINLYGLAMGFPNLDSIVIESPPHNVPSTLWSYIETQVKKKFPGVEICWMTPGLWKPMKQVLIRPGDKFKSDHEKDAVHIARFRIRQLISRRSAEA